MAIYFLVFGQSSNGGPQCPVFVPKVLVLFSWVGVLVLFSWVGFAPDSKSFSRRLVEKNLISPFLSNFLKVKTSFLF